ELALIRESGDDASRSGGIGAGEQHAARARKRALERHRFGKQLRVDRFRVGGGTLARALEVVPQRWCQHVKARRHRPARREGFEHRERRRERDALVDELADQGLERRASFVERGNRLLSPTLPWTHIGLLVSNEVG